MVNTRTTVVAEARRNYLKREAAWKKEHDGKKRGLPAQLSHEARSDGIEVTPMDAISALRKVMDAEDVNTVHFRPNSKAYHFISWLAQTEEPVAPPAPSAPSYDNEEWEGSEPTAETTSAVDEEKTESPRPISRKKEEPVSGLEVEVLRAFAEAYATTTRIFNTEYVEEVLTHHGCDSRFLAVLASVA